MTYRDGILPKSPLKYVVASIRFAPWPLLAKKVDEIQNELRDMLPLMNHIVLEATDGQAQPMGISHEAWMFADADKDYCAQVTKDQVIFFTSSYVNYKEFSDKNNRVLSTLYKFMNFIDVNNIGIRYLDHISPLSNEKKSDYISDKFLPPNVSGFPSRGSQVTADYSIGNDRLRVNIQGIPGALPIPQEMISLPVILNGPEKPFQIQPLAEQDLAVDMDAVSMFEHPKRLSMQELETTLDQLHKAANSFFRNADVFTDHAFKVWKGES